MDELDEVCLEFKEKVAVADPLQKTLKNQLEGWTTKQEEEVQKCLEDLNQHNEVSSFKASIWSLSQKNEEQYQQPKLELKQLPDNLKYAFLEEDGG